jgi:hypothetical protein
MIVAPAAFTCAMAASTSSLLRTLCARVKSVGLRAANGKWLMIHDHVSMPLDMQTMKAVRELPR